MAFLICNEEFKIGENPTTPEQTIESALEAEDVESTILIVPTGKLVRKYKREFIRSFAKVTNRPITEPLIFTIQDFAEACFDKIYGAAKPKQISEAYRLALFEEAFEKADAKFYKTANDKISNTILRRLADVIFGLKEDGITIADINKNLKDAQREDNPANDLTKLNDILQIYRKYEETLGEKYLDKTDIITNLIEKLTLDSDISIDKLFPRSKVILAYGFSEFRTPEREFFIRIAKTNAAFGLNLDYSFPNGPLFGNFEDNIKSLIKEGLSITPLDEYAEEEKTERKLDPKTESSKLPRSVFLRRWLFNYYHELNNPDFVDLVNIYAAENKTNEVKAICKLIKYLIVKENIKPWEITVCSRQPELYSALFRETFSMYQIPVNISDRFNLDASPVTNAIFSVLNLIHYGYRRRDLHKVLKSEYPNFSDATSSEAFDPDIFIDASLKLKFLGGEIRGGKKKWDTTLQNKINFLKDRINEIESSDTSDKTELFSLNNLKNKVETAKSTFELIASKLPDKKKQYSPAEFKELVKIEIVKSLKIRDAILDFYNDLFEKKEEIAASERVIYEESIEKDAKALAALLKLVDELCFITEDRFPNKKFKLEYFLNRLKTAVTAEKYQIAEKQKYGVEVTSIEQIRGIPYKVAILCGVIDGEFPISYKPERFLGIELEKSEIKHIRSERMQFYQFLVNNPSDLNKGEKRIYITYPKTAGEEELTRSHFIDALLKITTIEKDGKISDLSKLNQINVVESEENVLSNAQIKYSPWYFTIANHDEALEFHGKYGSENVDIPEKYSSVNLKEKIKYVNIYKERAGKSDGQINLDKLPEEIAKKIRDIKSQPISVSDLETYAKCPFQYFLRKILSVEPPEEPELALTPPETGSLLHKALYEFYASIQLRNPKRQEFPKKKNEAPDAVPVWLEKNKKEEYLRDLRKILEKELELYIFNHPLFRIDQDNLLGSSGSPGILDLWLREEFKRLEVKNDFAPIFFELSFGLKNALGAPSLPPIKLDDDLILKGKIDRAELRAGGNGAYDILIADYKLGGNNLPGLNEIKQGVSFQIPLYWHVFKQMLNQYYGIEANFVGGVYYILKPKFDDKKNLLKSQQFVLLDDDNLKKAFNLSRSKSQVIPKKDDLDQILKDSLKEAKTITNKISDGIFPVEPKDDKTCDYCKMQSVCRIRER